MAESKPRIQASEINVWCSHDKLVDVTELIENPRNPNKHPDKQIALLAKIIKAQGWRQPITVSKRSGFIVKGHGRLQSARLLQVENVPVDFQEYATEADEYADLMADNRIAELAEADDAMLADLLGDTMFDDFDMDLTGFDAESLGDMLQDAGTDGLTDEDAVPDHVLEKLKKASMLCVRELDCYLKGNSENILHPDFTIGTASVSFIEAKYLGSDYKRMNSLAFCRDQFFTAGDKYSIPAHLERTISGEAKIDGVIYGCHGNNISLRSLISNPMPMSGAKMPADFPATLARDIYDEFCKDGASILDPCHGWGGRITGALMLNKPISYTGIDPSPVANRSVSLIEKTFSEYCDEKNSVDLLMCPFEDAELDSKAFDFALTSPPYFDVEKYDGDETSAKKYSGGFDDWVDGFYSPMIRKVFDLLKNGCCFALQVGSQKYPLKETGIKIAEDAGFSVVDIRSAGMNRGGEKMETPEDKAECIIILKKRS